MITRRALWLLIFLSALAGCTKQPAPQVPDPQTILQAIPPADSAKYEHIQDMKNWRNPYLIVRADGVALFDSADSAEILLKPEDCCRRWRICRLLIGLTDGWWRRGRMACAGPSRTAWRFGEIRALWADCCRGRISRWSGCLRLELKDPPLDLDASGEKSKSPPCRKMRD